MQANFKLLFALALISALALTVAVIGCSSGDDDDDDDDDTDDDDDDDASCTVEDLCTFGVACGGYPDVETCMEEGESEAENCADADALLDCACGCLDTYSPGEDCTGFGTCAEQCYEEHC